MSRRINRGALFIAITATLCLLVMVVAAWLGGHL